MSSSKPEEEVVQHFTHIHPLTVVTERKFICERCNTHGNGKTYRCAQCNYDHPTHVSHVPQPAHVVSVKTKKFPGSKPNLHPTQCHPNHGCGHKNQGQGQVLRRSKRKIMLDFLMDVTVKVVTNLINSSLDSEDYCEDFSEDSSEDFSY